MQGIILKRNKQGHKVVRLHYTADPEKAKQEWIDHEAAKYVGGRNSLMWRREMEIDFKAGAGELVFPEFGEMENELCVDPFDIDETYNLFGGFDWGTRNPFSFHVYAESTDNQFYSIWELYNERWTVPQVAQAIYKCPYYSRLNWIAADPTIWTENISKKDHFTSVASMFQDEEEVGTFVIDKLMPAHDRSDVSGINKVKSLWMGKKLKFFKSCPVQISEVKNLKYPERKENVNETEKILDKNNHSWDDLKYFVLSHPIAKTLVQRPKYGTMAYINAISREAAEMADVTGRSVQECFNELYGKTL